MIRTFIDQYGSVWHARNVTDLRRKIGGRCSRMYRDTASGGALHIGYVIGGLWLAEFAPVERAA